MNTPRRTAAGRRGASLYSIAGNGVIFHDPRRGEAHRGQRPASALPRQPPPSRRCDVTVVGTQRQLGLLTAVPSWRHGALHRPCSGGATKLGQHDAVGEATRGRGPRHSALCQLFTDVATAAGYLAWPGLAASAQPGVTRDFIAGPLTL